MESEHGHLGAEFGEIAGWRLPLQYRGADHEQRMVRSHAGVIDWSARGKIRVTGPDRLTFLDGLLTNDMKSLGEGRGLYAATLDHKGRVHGDLVVYDLGDEYWLETEPEAGDRVLAHLNRLLVSDDVTLDDVTDSWAVLGLFGPQSRRIATEVFGAPTLPHDYDHASVPFQDGSARIARSPYLGGEGYEAWVPPETVRAAFHAMVDGGATPFGHLAAEALRVEAGRPKYPTDMDEDTIVLEARLESAISMTKGCYVGQEVVSRATYIGHVNRVLVGLRIDSKDPPHPGVELLAEGKSVGKVTSAVRSAGLGQILGLGYIRRHLADPGTKVSVGRDGDETATVAALPFSR